MLSTFGITLTWYFAYFMWFQQNNFLLLVQPDKIDYTFFNESYIHTRNVTETMQNCIAILSPILELFSSVYQHCTKNELIICNNENPWWTTQTMIRLALALLIILFNLPNSIFLALNLRFRDRAKIFMSHITEIPDIPMSHVLEEYYKLESAINQLNSKFSAWLLVTSVISIPFLSQKFIQLFKGSESILTAILNVPYFVAMFFNLLMAANTCQQVSSLTKDVNS